MAEDSKSARSAESKTGVPQIEVTPEMIRAGCEALYVRDWGQEPGEWAVTRVYRAMETERVLSARKTP